MNPRVRSRWDKFNERLGDAATTAWFLFFGGMGVYGCVWLLQRMVALWA